MAVFVGQDGIAVLACKGKNAYVQALAGAHPQVQILDLMVHTGVFPSLQVQRPSTTWSFTSLSSVFARATLVKRSLTCSYLCSLHPGRVSIVGGDVLVLFVSAPADFCGGACG